MLGPTARSKSRRRHGAQTFVTCSYYRHEIIKNCSQNIMMLHFYNWKLGHNHGATSVYKFTQLNQTVTSFIALAVRCVISFFVVVSCF